MPKVVSLNLSTEKGTSKIPVDKVNLILEKGLLGDAHFGNDHRQVSLLAIESINKMKSMGASWLHPGSFAENITTVGITLHHLNPGDVIEIGNCRLQISQIGKTCHNNCEIKEKIGNCIMPTEGIFARVIKAGIINIGDEIHVLKDNNI